MIGILYPRSLLRPLMLGKQSFEKPAFYIKAASEAGEKVIFFSLSDINWAKRTVTSWDGVGTVRSMHRLPPVIINRTRTNDSLTKRVIQRLKKLGIIVFNEHNVESKLHVHRILAANKHLLPYLPETDEVSKDSLKNLLGNYDCLYLKPTTSSVGTGIIRVRKEKSDCIADINMRGKTKHKRASVKKIVKLVKKRKYKYLVQQGISLMTYKEQPVDFRVSIQKDEDGAWQYVGMVGRVAQKGAVVTNLHCGGKSFKASELFEAWGWNGKRVEEHVAALGLNIAVTLEANLPTIADLGIDIALDEHQHPWLIEVNFRDLRITFREAGERDKWKKTFFNPVYYAAYLVRNSEGSYYN
ncbi:YheC/YheD family protein [Paenibacillus sp. GXUN7292]|uniref:YheC/YheD family endospore coat-associated protein n=1 Tax=Paenibacillus sp. GXUN7292 TaxID=3422499 RepID=UPI003D7D13AF